MKSNKSNYFLPLIVFLIAACAVPSQAASESSASGPSSVEKPPQKGSPSIPYQIVLDPSLAKMPSEVLATWLFYGGLRGAWIEKNGTAKTSEQQGYTPFLDEEVYAREQTAKFWEVILRQKKPGLSNSYLDDLLAIYQAGYVREYVVASFRVINWGPPQPALQTQAFNEWRETHLKNHKPVTLVTLKASTTGPDSKADLDTVVSGVAPNVNETGWGAQYVDVIKQSRALTGAGRFNDAKALLEEPLSRFRLEVNKPNRTAVCVSTKSEFEQYSKEHSGDPSIFWIDMAFPEALQLRAFLESSVKQYEAAMPLLEEAVRCAPYFANPYIERGYILNQLKRPREGLQAYEQALSLARTFPSSKKVEGLALRGMGLSLIDLGQLDQAETALKESLVIEPGNRVAQNELEYIRSLRKRTNR